MTSKTLFFNTAFLWRVAICCFPLLLGGCGGGSGSNCDGYTYNGGCVVSGQNHQSGPSISGVSPSSGPASGGATVTITGNHFTDNSQVPSVLFVSNANSSGQSYVTAKITQSTNTSLTVVSPPGAGTVDIVVSGVVYSTLSNADHYTYK